MDLDALADVAEDEQQDQEQKAQHVLETHGDDRRKVFAWAPSSLVSALSRQQVARLHGNGDLQGCAACCSSCLQQHCSSLLVVPVSIIVCLAMMNWVIAVLVV